jgi:hypothetical protein
MIAAEQETLLVQQHTMPPRMPGRWDKQEVLAKRHGLCAFKDDFRLRLGREFGAVDDALGRLLAGEGKKGPAKISLTMCYAMAGVWGTESRSRVPGRGTNGRDSTHTPRGGGVAW